MNIENGDTEFFIDECSMVVIFKKHEKEVIKRILTTIKNETNIINDIYKNITVEKIVEERGYF